MKTVYWTDADGFRRISLLRDQDLITEPHRGIPVDFPEIREMDWDGMVRELHNLLVDRGLTDRTKISAQGGAFENAIRLTITRPIIEYMKQPQQEQGETQ